MASDDTKQPSPADKPTDETIKETIESIVIAFVLAFVFRAYVVEAFVIPTGSMAPTLLGEHIRLRSPQSGYVYCIDRPQPDTRRGQRSAYDPMTRAETKLPARPVGRAGDRILVQKYVFALLEPRRWDVVVFKAPHDPHTNFIKRLVGLPNEQIRILDGNIYVKPDEGNWTIARKTDRPRVQQAVWQPIYDSRYVPLDGGGSRNWAVPWVAGGSTADQWQIENRRSYTYDSAEPGHIGFEFQRGHFQKTEAMYPYNQLTSGQPTPIEDVRIGAGVQPRQHGLKVRLSTTARLNSRTTIDRLIAAVDPDGTVRLLAANSSSTIETELVKGQTAPLPAGRSTRIELWFVDQEASVWVNDRRLIFKRFDHSMQDVLLKRRGPEPLPRLRIDVADAPVTLHEVRIDRDLFYTVSQDGSGIRARGGVDRRDDGLIIAEHQRLELREDEFFCLGDNSPKSHDSRYWAHVNPWITEYASAGAVREGIVPRELMIGRAFLVYFPAPFPWKPNGWAVFPNFGDMRFIH